jgi:hypothetical protein
VVEGARLESAYTAKNRIVGSNPTPSANCVIQGRPDPSRRVARNPCGTGISYASSVLSHPLSSGTIPMRLMGRNMGRKSVAEGCLSSSIGSTR